MLSNGLKLRASAVDGGNGIEGDDVALAGLHDRLSYSVGHYRFATDGFRDNNDLRPKRGQRLRPIPAEPDTSLQFELRSARVEHGDQTTYFNRDVYAPQFRLDEDADSLRLGAKHELTPRHTLLGSMILQDVANDAAGPRRLHGVDRPRRLQRRCSGVFRSDGMTVQSGLVAAQGDETTQITVFAPPGFDSLRFSAADTNRQVGLYSYVTFDPTPTLTVTAGTSFDAIEIGPPKKTP